MNFPMSFSYAYRAPIQTVQFKQCNSDFKVVELPEYAPTGEGEHLWLYIEKDGMNTAFLAEIIAQWAGVSVNDIGYAGRKDRNAITRQWFSIYLAQKPNPARPFVIEGVTLLEMKRSQSKLRRGQLVGNQFELVLRDVKDKADLECRLEHIKTMGVPNYFGAQRFGRDGGNLPRAMELIERRALNKRGNDIYLSAARSYLFNQLVSNAVDNNNWVGENAALWGRGRATESETVLLEPWAELRDALEFTGLKQEHRAMQLMPVALDFTWQDDSVLCLTFILPSGCFATSVLRELAYLEEPQRILKK